MDVGGTPTIQSSRLDDNDLDGRLDLFDFYSTPKSHFGGSQISLTDHVNKSL